MDRDPLHMDSCAQIISPPKGPNCRNSSELNDTADAFSYTHTIMYGRYATDLSSYAKDEARKLRLLEKRHNAENERRQRMQLEGESGPVRRAFLWLWDNTLARFGEEWIFLALMGTAMALISFFMDYGIHVITTARIWLFRDIFNSTPFIQFCAWIFPIICLVLFSVGFTHIVAPQAAGSGIPEMRTIMRGVVLKEYLTFKVLVAKVIGLTTALGSGIPIGKEGPFVHIASIVATLLSKLKFHRIYENKSRYNEMLAAAAACGIGACFAAPIGGVLFSIEVTTTYFAVRNCWRGFFSAVCGSSILLLMVVWLQEASTVKAIFLTNFTSEFPFAPQELFLYAFLGVICGFLGAGYVWLHRWYVQKIRGNKTINDFLQKNRLIYPTIIALVVAVVSFPLGTGQFVGAELSTHEQLTHLFGNFSWFRGNLTVEEAAVVSQWKTPNTSVFVSLFSFSLFTYIFSVICYTLPVPSGSFIPVFKIGAGLGKIFGELVHLSFPRGVWYGGVLSSVVPGGYAVACAAALSSAVTHTVSEAVIIFEITGQVTHVVPVMIASLIANAVAEMLQPSMYDSMIMIKKLPYLPDLIPSSSKMYNTLVKDFMVRDVKYIWPEITYQKLKELLLEHRGIRNLPLVDSPENMMLLGSIQRSELIKMIENHIGREKRLDTALKWQQEAELGEVAEEQIQEHEQEQELERQQTQQQMVRRRSSRFEVLPAPDILTSERNTDDDTKRQQETPDNSFYAQGPKSILKKTNSFNNGAPISESEYRLRSAFEDILKKSSKLEDVECGIMPQEHQSLDDQKTPNLSANLKKVQLSKDCVVDMLPEDRKLWEREQMSKQINLEEHHVAIDPSPFQLVERTSVVKVHTLFNMVGINHAYVTKVGRLVGVVGLTELRKVIENINNNTTTLSVSSKDYETKPLIDSDKNVNTTITSMDSAFSVGSSGVESDIEIVPQKLKNLV